MAQLWRRKSAMALLRIDFDELNAGWSTACFVVVRTTYSVTSPFDVKAGCNDSLAARSKAGAILPVFMEMLVACFIVRSQKGVTPRLPDLALLVADEIFVDPQKQWKKGGICSSRGSACCKGVQPIGKCSSMNPLERMGTFLVSPSSIPFEPSECANPAMCLAVAARSRAPLFANA